MPTIRIQGTELAYEEADIIIFDEGLIGLPHLRRMVLLRQTNIEPFLWLASLDDPEMAFLLVEPRTLFPYYEPSLPVTSFHHQQFSADDKSVVLAIVLIASDWKRSTINLRAPIFISAREMRGAQIVLTDSPYRLAEPLPLARAA